MNFGKSHRLFRNTCGNRIKLSYVIAFCVVIPFLCYLLEYTQSSHNYHSSVGASVRREYPPMQEGEISKDTLDAKLPKGRYPDCVLIGAKKCGTGLLRFLLLHHPSVAMALDEVHFFDKHLNKVA